MAASKANINHSYTGHLVTICARSVLHTRGFFSPSQHTKCSRENRPLRYPHRWRYFVSKQLTEAVGFILISTPDEAAEPGNREMRSRSAFLVLFYEMPRKLKANPMMVQKMYRSLAYNEFSNSRLPNQDYIQCFRMRFFIAIVILMYIFELYAVNKIKLIFFIIYHLYNMIYIIFYAIKIIYPFIF